MSEGVINISNFVSFIISFSIPGPAQSRSSNLKRVPDRAARIGDDYLMTKAVKWRVVRMLRNAASLGS